MMRRPSTATMHGGGSGTTPRGPIVVSPVDGAEPGLMLGKCERGGREFVRDEMRNPYPTTSPRTSAFALSTPSQQTQLTGYQQVHFPSVKPIPPSSTLLKSAVINTHPDASSSSSHVHPPPSAHPNPNSSHHQPPPGLLTHSIQQILNNAYLGLLAVVETKEKKRSDKHDRAEKERSRGEKEMFERALEERNRMLRSRDEKIAHLRSAGSSKEKDTLERETLEKDVATLQSENSHLKGELFGIKSDKEEMQEEIDDLQMQVREGGSQVALRQDMERIREDNERLREERKAWVEEKAMSLREREEMIRGREHQQLQQQQSINETNNPYPYGNSTNEEIPMLSSSPTDVITASPLSFTAPLPSPSPRPSSRQADPPQLDTRDHRHAQTLPVPPLMGSLLPESHSAKSNSRSAPGEGRDSRYQAQHRPTLSLPGHLSDHNSSMSAVSPHPRSPLPHHHYPSRPSSRPSPSSATATSPNQVLSSLPFSSSSSNSRPPSRASLNINNGRKRTRDDPAVEEEGEISPLEHRHPSSIPPPPKITKRSSGREEGEIAENSGEKPSKAAKRFSSDDAATSSSSINDRGTPVHTSPPNSSSSIPPSRYGNGSSNGYSPRNPYVTPYSGNAISGVSGLPAKPRSSASGSASVEDGVFRHVQHGPQTLTPSKPVSFWKSVSSSAIADERKEEKEKDEEPKLGLKHFRLLYGEVGKDYVCRECRYIQFAIQTQDLPPVHRDAEMTEHSWKDHPERCKEILKYSTSKLTE
ncbi:hypothetical protein V5O48_006033 [Marasmius crinis-equi]|uniref:Uncharacterized protein n=1 Tax=Marasmius crinis-equi TaxID=585013 RepID=A0ABR3FKN6_9AGAR